MCACVREKQKTVFLDRIKSEQQDHQAVKEAYDKLHQKHTELSAQPKVQAQHLYELEVQTQYIVYSGTCVPKHKS